MDNDLLISYNDVELWQQETLVLEHLDLQVKKGEFIYLLGKVGSGKSTLMKSLYHEVPIASGEASIFAYDLQKMKTRDIAYLRRKIGIVFQDFQLLTDRRVDANLEFVLRATGWKNKSEIKAQIHEVLTQVGMQNKSYKMPHELSGGEQQRVVIARALLNSPKIILADEPTGNLDPRTGEKIMELLMRICNSGTTVLVATHNLGWLKKFPGRMLMCGDTALKEVSLERTEKAKDSAEIDSEG